MCDDAFKPDQDPGASGVGGLEDAVQDNGGAIRAVDAVPGKGEAVPAAPTHGSGTGVDSGVGGLY
jgi:hypothetical protein